LYFYKALSFFYFLLLEVRDGKNSGLDPHGKTVENLNIQVLSLSFTFFRFTRQEAVVGLASSPPYIPPFLRERERERERRSERYLGGLHSVLLSPTLASPLVNNKIYINTIRHNNKKNEKDPADSERG
jgi:hypothetical protein